MISSAAIPMDCSCPLPDSDGAHPFRARNDLNKAELLQLISNENSANSTKLTVFLSLMTVWMQFEPVGYASAGRRSRPARWPAVRKTAFRSQWQLGLTSKIGTLCRGINVYHLRDQGAGAAGTEQSLPEMLCWNA